MRTSMTLAAVPLALLVGVGCAHSEAAGPEETGTTAQAQTAPEDSESQAGAQTGEQAGMHAGMHGEMHGEMGEGAMAHDCPSGLEGVQVEALDAEGGVALRFSIDDPDKVADLQGRVRQEATMIAHHHAARHDPEMQAEMEQMMERERAGQAEAPTAEGPAGASPSEPLTYDLEGLSMRVENNPDGASLLILPGDSRMAQRVKDRMMGHVQAMQEGACPMQGLPEGEAGPDPGGP